MAKIRFRDSDDGATTMDVVEVPEGFSFQVAEVKKDYSSMSFVSVILNRSQANDLRDFLGGLAV